MLVYAHCRNGEILPLEAWVYTLWLHHQLHDPMLLGILSRACYFTKDHM